jgi:hypothetical protein
VPASHAAHRRKGPYPSNLPAAAEAAPTKSALLLPARCSGVHEIARDQVITIYRASRAYLNVLHRSGSEDYSVDAAELITYAVIDPLLPSNCRMCLLHTFLSLATLRRTAVRQLACQGDLHPLPLPAPLSLASAQCRDAVQGQYCHHCMGIIFVLLKNTPVRTKDSRLLSRRVRTQNWRPDVEVTSHD